MSQNYYGTIDLVRHIEITRAIADALQISAGDLVGREFYYNVATRTVFLEQEGRYVQVARLTSDPIGTGSSLVDIFRGDWVPDIKYTSGQIVHRDGIDWIAATPNVGMIPGASTAWRRLVSIGVPTAWEAGPYSSGFIVSYDGKFYIARRDTAEGPPDASADWAETITAGPQGLQGEPGERGFMGWSPNIAGEAIGLRRVLKVIGWTGGEGEPPTAIGYIGPEGLTLNPAEATDFRGQTGASGPASLPGTGVGSGGNGWTPEFAGEVDGTRRVLRVVDWAGGTGDKPAIGLYVGPSGFVSDITQAVDFRGAAGAGGPAGATGNKGWSPKLSVEIDGARRVFRVVDWVGGVGAKPVDLGYLGAGGIVQDIADAINVRGSTGAPGPAGVGSPGSEGDSGWSPVLAAVIDGSRRVFRITDWTGGQGAKPSTTGYIALGGLSENLADAVDFRGAAGAGGPAGPHGWAPIFGVQPDGERRVLRVVDWTGGQGEKPAVGQYVGAAGLVDLSADAVDVRGATGAPGAAGVGSAGPAGSKGWSPVLTAVPYGERRLLQVTDWIGGEDAKPATGGYLGGAGFVTDPAQAVDFRGPLGPQGGVGPAGPPDELTQQYRSDALAARDQAVAATGQAVDALSTINQLANATGIARDQAVAAAGSIQKQGAASRGRSGNFAVSGNESWVTVPLDIEVFRDPDAFSWEPGTNSLVPTLIDQERLELFAAVRFSAQAGGSYRAMRVIAVNPDNAADFVVPLEIERQPSTSRDTILHISNISLPPKNWKLQLQARHDYSVLSIPQNIDVTGCYLTARVARGKQGPPGIAVRETIRSYSFTAPVGGQTVFPIPDAFDGVLMATAGGAPQQLGTDYSFNAGGVTFSTSVPAGTKVQIVTIASPPGQSSLLRVQSGTLLAGATTIALADPVDVALLVSVGSVVQALAVDFNVNYALGRIELIGAALTFDAKYIVAYRRTAVVV